MFSQVALNIGPFMFTYIKETFLIFLLDAP